MFFKKTKLIKQLEVELANIKIELDQTLNNNNELIHIKDVEINKYKSDIEELNRINKTLLVKYARFIDHEELFENEKIKYKELVQSRIELNEKYQLNLSLYNQLDKEIKIFQDAVDLHEYGVYEPNFNFNTSEEFKEAIRLNNNEQKKLIIDKKAIILKRYPSDEIVDLDAMFPIEKSNFNNTKKLILYAFNAECDSIISKLKWYNVGSSIERIYLHCARIFKYSLGLHHYDTNLDSNKLATWHITKEYVDLKIKELMLTYEYLQKKQNEKEEQKRIREQIREEEKALRDYEKAEREAEEDEKYLQKALEKIKQKFGIVTPDEIDALNIKVKELEKQIKEAQEKKERAIALAQTTKVGYIYVISNIGSLGEDVYKIGMTRRLDPQDRVDELSNASVPFRFDVHAVIFSENAPQLEYELHQKFNDRRINRVNRRKEFFKVKLEDIEEFVKEHADAKIEFTKIAEAREYRETMTVIEQLYKIVENVEVESKFPESLLD